MRRSNKTQSRTLRELAEAVGAQLDGDGALVIRGAAPIQSASEGDISFVANPAYKKHIDTTHASALVLDLNTPSPKPAIRHANPYLTFARIIDLLHPDPVLVSPGCHVSSVVETTAQVHNTASVGPLCHISEGATIAENTQLVSGVFIGQDVEIGRNCLIYPGVQIMHGCKVGDNVIIHAGTVIGSDGFGYAPSETGLKKIKQIGWVEIGNTVEIGANVTIDRGALGPTKIGDGTKIDNLVQIAHNVETGQHCIIISQVGISGSTKLGNGVILAGQVGLVGHIEIGDGVKIGAQSGVNKSIPANKDYFGYPAREKMEAMRIEAALARLPELLRRVRELEELVRNLNSDSGR